MLVQSLCATECLRNRYASSCRPIRTPTLPVRAASSTRSITNCASSLALAKRTKDGLGPDGSNSSGSTMSGTSRKNGIAAIANPSLAISGVLR